MRPDKLPPTKDQIRSLLGYAILAPSSHNTQPWRFEITEGAVSLFADRTRALPANDPQNRELTISCGCALMNLRVAAAHEGMGVSVDLNPDPDNSDRLAVVSFHSDGSVSPSEAGLFPSIEARRTYRKRFAPREVPKATLNALVSAASENGCGLVLLESEDQRHKAAELVSEGDAVQWADPDWRQELAEWMHPRRQGDGLTVPGLVAPLAQAVVRTFDMGHGVGAKDEQLADESPVLAVLGTAADNRADWLAAGQALQRVLLVAHTHGLQASYLNQPIQVASLRPKLQKLLSQGGFPQILLRLGHPEKDIHGAPRRPLDDVIA
ncbi:MAG: nitroreductase family protein [Marinobacter sp.]|nr:nitroreductase family protein [Marinobacter sp.]